MVEVVFQPGTSERLNNKKIGPPKRVSAPISA